MSQTVVKLHFAPARPRLQDRLAQFCQSVAAARHDAATRRVLAKLDDRALADIGMSRAQAQSIAQRPVWELFAGNYR